MKIKTFFRRLDYRHYICILLTVGSLLFTVFCFRDAFVRIGESFRDLGISIAYYFCMLFDIDYGFTVTVNEFSSTSLPWVILPQTWEAFKTSWVQYWLLWANLENFSSYFSFLAVLCGNNYKMLGVQTDCRGDK